MLSTKQVKSKIKELLSGQKFAVLATHTRDYPYTSLVGFVASEDLSYLIFAVSRESRKYSYMVENNIVSMLIDDRKNEPGDFRQASAVTIMGEAETIDSNQRQYCQLLEKKNPFLKEFLELPSTVIIKVQVIKYFLVAEFQDVHEWKVNIPDY